METTHTVTVEEVINNTATFQKNLQNIVLHRVRVFNAKQEYRRKNHIAPLPSDPITGLSKIKPDRLATLYMEVRERRCSTLSSPARRVLAECGDEAVKASMEEFTRKMLQKPAEKAAAPASAPQPKKKTTARKKTAKTPAK